MSDDLLDFGVFGKWSKSTLKNRIVKSPRFNRKLSFSIIYMKIFELIPQSTDTEQE